MTEYKYCPHCATPLESRDVYGRQRAVCPTCSFIQFHDPKVAVIGLVTHEDRVLLICRAIDPGKGKWALPGGFMDAGEMPAEALQRELQEEVNLRVRVLQLLDIFPMAVRSGRRQGIVLAFHAEPEDAQQIDLCCDAEVSDARWFATDELPINLAFESTHTLLAQWRETARQGDRETR
jgi:ADP-ribose pyrophosphatase YjhB (NUDIX family)